MVMMAIRVVILSATLLSAACATQPVSSAPTESLAMIVWAKPASGCDFENPDRDMAIVISTTINTDARRSPRKRGIYHVKDTQMLVVPRAGETLCASLVRYHRISVSSAVYGLEIDTISDTKLSVRPVYARVSDRQDRPVHVSLDISAAHIVEGHATLPQTVRLDFGAVTSDQPKTVNSESRVFDGPTGTEIFRLAAIVVEDSARLNGSEVISDSDLIRLLSETNRTADE